MNLLIRTDPFQFIFLENPQELGLGKQRQLPDFVQKQGSPLCHFYFTDFTAFFRTGKRPLFIPEQLTFK